MQQTTSSLTPLKIGDVFNITHGDFQKYKVPQVTYLGDQGTSYNDYYLFEGLKPSGEKKSINYPKQSFDAGRYDRYFTFVSSSQSTTIPNETTTPQVTQSNATGDSQHTVSSSI